MHIWLHAAQVSRKLTFLYLANDVIQNSKKKGPEFTQDFAPIIVDAFKHVYRSESLVCFYYVHFCKWLSRMYCWVRVRVGDVFVYWMSVYQYIKNVIISKPILILK